MNDRRASTSTTSHEVEDDHIREIHALTPPRQGQPPANQNNRRRGQGAETAWETTSNRSLVSHSQSMASEASTSSEIINFTSMSREFNALVIAGAGAENNDLNNNNNNNNLHSQTPNNGNSNLDLARIGEFEGTPEEEEINPLAIVPENHHFDDRSAPAPAPSSSTTIRSHENTTGGGGLSSSSRNGQISLETVKKEEVECKISAWQNAKIAKINNRFKREDAIITGWENEQVHNATTWMKAVERKLEEKRARAMEKMQNEVAKAHRKAEERRASAEAKRGTKVAKVLEISNLMRAVGRPPAKRSFF